MNVPFYPAEILLPKKDFEKWSVIACDQYTSDKAYWDDVEKIVGETPSTLRITLPEIYLEENDVDSRISRINETMGKYVENGVFNVIPNTFVYTERVLATDAVRHGIIGAIDLEAYDFAKDSTSLVRATEKTVAERIPPRVRIRKNAPLELPHVMILIDDPTNSVIKPLTDAKNIMTKLYDFKLMKNGGQVRGYRADGNYADGIIKNLEKLYEKSRNSSEGKAPILFAVGDGNHSLATAKTCWEEIKKNLSEEEKATHPARFALAEIVNLHDESLEFEPIHRVVFNTDTEKFLDELRKFFDGAVSEDNCDVDDFNDFVVVSEKYEHIFEITKKKSNLTVGDVQEFLDYYIKNIDTSAKIDYIHGDGVAIELGKKSGNVALLMPVMQKSELFKTVMIDGVLPRKTFSMGEADSKRFYLEAKKIIK